MSRSLSARSNNWDQPSAHSSACRCRACDARIDRDLEFLIDSVDDASSMEHELPTTAEPTPGAFYQIKRGDQGLLRTAQRVHATGSREHRAKVINAHPANRKFWRTPQNDYERRVFSDGIISFLKIFTCGKNQRLASGSEQKCYARIFIPPYTEVFDPIDIRGDRPDPPPPVDDVLKEVIDSTDDRIKRCVASKLRDNRYDHHYLSNRELRTFFDLPLREAENNDLFSYLSSMKEEMEAKRRKLERGNPSMKDPKKEIAKIFNDGYDALYQGIRMIEYLPVYDPRSRQVRTFYLDRSKRSDSLYSCPDLQKMIEAMLKAGRK